MRLLSRQAFEAARSFLKSRARRLDLAVFEYRFENGAAAAVLDALGAYQNPDGGFGNALEPDLRTPSSSALATAIGMEVMTEIECNPEEPRLRSAVEYLEGTHDSVTNTWRAVPNDTGDYPHAIWWEDENGGLARLFHDFRIIPRAAILASLHTYPGLVPKDWLAGVTEDCVRFIEMAPLDAFRLDGFAYGVRLAEAPMLPDQSRQRLRLRLGGVVESVVNTDPESWSQYCLAPLKAAPGPDSLAALQLDTAIEMHLDYTIVHQTDEGAWNPTWEWRTPYPEAWATAKDEWRGYLTLENLTLLRAFDRLAR